ncbi:MAG TPA: hypothetical protein V6D08_16365 [Candidatus Obscuribacterales bacterium]
MGQPIPEYLDYLEGPPPEIQSPDVHDALVRDAYSEQHRQPGSDKSKHRQSDDELKEKFGQPTIDGAADNTSLVARPPQLERDEAGRVVEYTTPQGNKCEITYDDRGRASQVIVRPPHGRPEILERTSEGWWKVNGTIDYDLKVEVLSEGSVKRTHRDGTLVTYPDGTAEGRDHDNRPTFKIDKDGTRTVFKYDGTVTSFGSKEVTKAGSPITQIYEFFSTPESWRFHHRHGRQEWLKKQEDREWHLIRGNKIDRFPWDSRVEMNADGDRKITRPDGSSFEGKADGTTIMSNKAGQVTEITSPDGIVTAFSLDDKGKVSGILVKDGSGRVIESITRGGDGWNSALTDGAGKPVKIKSIELDHKTGTYSLVTETGRIIRSPDGTEAQQDRVGKSVEDYDNKVVSWMKKAGLELSPEQKRTLQADLAVINKLPPEQKARILISLDRIINGNSDGKTELSKSQRAELATSLAHQIAHPESITQGGKRAAGMASAERLMSAVRPDQYARMVADLAVDGRHTTRDGHSVTVQRTNYGFLDGKTDSYNMRSLTSELFQNAAANIALRKEHKLYRSYLPDASELDPRPAGVDPALDTGERLVDMDGRVRRFDGLTAEQRKNLLVSLGIDGYDAGTIASSKDLLAAWESRADKNVPLQIAIKVPKDIGYFTREWQFSPEVDHEYHILTITHIDTSTSPARVYFDNTAGGEDHSYPHGTAILSWDIRPA